MGGVKKTSWTMWCPKTPTIPTPRMESLGMGVAHFLLCSFSPSGLQTRTCNPLCENNGKSPEFGGNSTCCCSDTGVVLCTASSDCCDLIVLVVLDCPISTPKRTRRGEGGWQDSNQYPNNTNPSPIITGKPWSSSTTTNQSPKGCRNDTHGCHDKGFVLAGGGGGG